MIKRLSESGTDSDDVSMLNSKITKLNRDILNREIALITADMEEAQSYLTKISSSIAKNIREGKKPIISAELKTQAGVENLVRARSVQAGAIKRLELLLAEEMDTVTKSKLVGLLEAQKAALIQMDGTIHETKATSFYYILYIALGIIFTIIFCVSVFIILKRKNRVSG